MVGKRQEGEPAFSFGPSAAVCVRVRVRVSQTDTLWSFYIQYYVVHATKEGLRTAGFTCFGKEHIRIESVPLTVKMLYFDRVASRRFVEEVRGERSRLLLFGGAVDADD